MILDDKYENSYLTKVMKNQYHNLTEDQWKYLLKLLQKPRSCSMKNLVHGRQIHYISK